MLENLTIRLATRTDLPALEWDGEYIHYRNIFRDTFQRYQKGEALLWVAELQTPGLIGQAFVQLVGSRPELANGKERAYIYSIRVRPAYRGLGIGTRLIQTAEDDLIARGFSCLTLNVGKNNPEAKRLYERLGFQVVAPEPGAWSYIDHRGQRRHVNEPAWRMEKRFSKLNKAL